MDVIAAHDNEPTWFWCSGSDKTNGWLFEGMEENQPISRCLTWYLFIYYEQHTFTHSHTDIIIIITMISAIHPFSSVEDSVRQTSHIFTLAISY